MRSNVLATAGKSNVKGAENSPKQDRIRHHTLSVMRAARSCFPSKTVEQLVAITEASETTVKEWMRGEREMRLDHFCRLLATEHTMSFLDAATEKKRPVIWRLLKLLIGVTNATKLQNAAQKILQREVSGAFEANAITEQALSRAHALLIQDEDFHSEHFAALGSLAGMDNRPMAQAGKVRRK
jgi:hypothetical protein